MRSEVRSVLQRDLLLGLIMVATGLLAGGVEALRSLPGVAVTIGVLLAVTAYVGEHDVVPGLFPEVATMAGFVVALAAGLAFVVFLSAPVDTTSAAALTGGGVGYGLYRVLFGLVLPVPEYRLENERGEGSPEPGEEF